MDKRKRILLAMFLTIIVSGFMASVGIFLNSITILIVGSLILVSFPFTAYKLVKNAR